MAKSTPKKKTGEARELVDLPPKQYVQWSPRVEEAIVQSMCAGASMKAACAAAGVSTRNCTNQLDLRPDFKDRVIMARERVIGVVEGALTQAAIDTDHNGRGDTHAKKLFLTNRAPDRYSERIDVHSHGDMTIRESEGDGSQAFTPEEREALKGVARKRILTDADPDRIPY